MPPDSVDLARCTQLIERQLGWGAASTWTSADFDSLQQQMLAATGVSLSTSTLRRLWGRVDYQHLPSATTLNTLARFAGYPDWRRFVQAPTIPTPPPGPHEVLAAPPTRLPRHGRWLAWGVSLVLAGLLLSFVVSQQRPRPRPAGAYRFSSRPVTRTIPNSVIFTYDASAAPTDSVAIQQSWDATRRQRVAKTGSTHTAIYYEPGFYQAELVVDGQTVKAHPLLIPTAGWLGAIMTSPVPTYLRPSDFVQPGQLRLPVAVIQAQHVALQPQAPLVRYFNVGNFTPVPLENFAFRSDLKNEYGTGTAACQWAWVTLVTTGEPIIIPLSAKGCVSELTLDDGARSVSGKTTDLSAFGVDFTGWVRVACRSQGDTIRYYINDKLAYASALPAQKATIVGLIYGFRGTGAVKGIDLRTAGRGVFHAF